MWFPAASTEEKRVKTFGEELIYQQYDQKKLINVKSSQSI